MLDPMEGIEALTQFYERELIVDEPAVVKSGKEGTVYRRAAMVKKTKRMPSTRATR